MGIVGIGFQSCNSTILVFDVQQCAIEVDPIYFSATSNANVGSTEKEVEALKIASQKVDAMLFKEVTRLEGEENLTYVDLIEHNIDFDQDLLKGRHNEDTITNAHISHNFSNFTNCIVHLTIVEIKATTKFSLQIQQR